MLFYLRWAIKQYSDISFNKFENYDYFFSEFQHKLFPHYFSYKHSSAVRTESICETSPSDAVPKL